MRSVVVGAREGRVLRAVCMIGVVALALYAAYSVGLHAGAEIGVTVTFERLMPMCRWGNMGPGIT